MYELRYSGAAQKYFKKIKENGLQKAFEDALTSIVENPYISTAKISKKYLHRQTHQNSGHH